MLIYRIILVLISTSFLLSGCSSRSDLIASSFLKTHIQDNDAKIFTLYLTPVNDKASQGSAKPKGEQNNKPSKPKGKGDRPGKQQGQEQGRGPQSKQSSAQANKTNASSRDQEKINQVILEILDQTLTKQGFCREGYIELSRSLGKGLFKIKGECHESATATDKKRFPNDL